MEKLGIDENGWVVSGPAENVSGFEIVEYDGDVEIEPADPSRVSEAWNWNGGSPELQSTENNIPPEPDEAKSKLFAHATDSNGWGWDRSKLRTVRREEGLFFDFLDAENYDEAKVEATDSSSLTDSETQWIHDLLDGKIN
jgi:hypothetical protein